MVSCPLSSEELGKAKADMSGQAYVAISRATAMDGLQVLNFTPQWYVVSALQAIPKADDPSVKVCNRVVQWSMSVEGDI
jgi:hypothetical protein